MQGIITKIFKQVFQSDNSSMCLLDHAAFYYRALQDNVEEVKRAFVAMEVEMSKYRDNLSNELSFEEDFNTLSMIYRQKEYKFIKNYEYFITMRSKELGIVETNLPELEENGFELGNISDGLMTSSNQYTREQEL